MLACPRWVKNHCRTSFLKDEIFEREMKIWQNQNRMQDSREESSGLDRTFITIWNSRIVQRESFLFVHVCLLGYLLDLCLIGNGTSPTGPLPINFSLLQYIPTDVWKTRVSLEWGIVLPQQIFHLPFE